MKKRTNKPVLNRETLRDLQDAELARVRGGEPGAVLRFEHRVVSGACVPGPTSSCILAADYAVAHAGGQVGSG